MAKRRRRKHSSKCPEPFNTLLDLAGGFAMGAVASHMEKKCNYSKKGKINPYSVSALGIATGRMKTTEDIIRTGATLGAMGLFDVDSDDTYSHSTRKPDDSVFQQIREPKRNDNRYAWRLNCEDGSSYGISPYDYETRSEYSEAIQNAKQCNQQRKNTKQSMMTGSARLDGSEVQFLFVRVSRLDNGANQYFLSNQNDLCIGETVQVPTGNGTASGIIIGLEWYTRSNAPQPVDDTPWLD